MVGPLGNSVPDTFHRTSMQDNGASRAGVAVANTGGSEQEVSILWNAADVVQKFNSDHVVATESLVSHQSAA